jgi:hypothetical protein
MARRLLTVLLVIASFLGVLGFDALGVPHQLTRTAMAKDGPAPVVDYFPVGVVEDANIPRGNTSRFDRMLRDLTTRGMDSVFMVNNFSKRDAPLLDVADQYNFNMYMMPAGDWNKTWWPSSIPNEPEAARDAAQPVVDNWNGHPSLKGYVLKDEPFLSHIPKLQTMAHTMWELDPDTPLMATLVGLDRVGPIYTEVGFDVMVIDVYPFGLDNPPCDMRMTGFGYKTIDFVSYIRAVSRDRLPETPLWIILQTHSLDNGRFSLRQPSPSEVRMQQWLALGEGATGIFWFIYSTQQSWIGLVDNPELFDEVTAQNLRLQRLRDLFLSLEKTDDRFTVAGAHDPYISTLTSRDDDYDQRLFALAVNRDCQQEQDLTINIPDRSGKLRDVETGQLYTMGEEIPFRPGDGRMFELLAQIDD